MDMQASAESTQTVSAVRKLALWIIAVGIAWRLLRYLLHMPLWGDEASVALTFLDRTWIDLLKPLENQQVAPIGFLWVESVVCRILGVSELSLRLLPLLSGVAAMLIFMRLAFLSLGKQPALIATGILAVAYYPVRHAVEAKPYSMDLLASVAILMLATEYLLRRKRWSLVMLGLSMPLMLAVSYPSVFVAGAASVAVGWGLRPGVARLDVNWRQLWIDRALWVFWNLILLGSFAASLLLAGDGQYASTGSFMREFWKNSFPPAGLLPLLRWLFDVHTGLLFAYPTGGNHGGSIVSFVFFVVGVKVFWRRLPVPARLPGMLLVVVPFALTLVAAALQRYPYGGQARISQHLAPAICLMVGLGLWSVIEWFARRRSALVRPGFEAASIRIVIAILFLMGGAGMIIDIVRPYKTLDDLRVRNVVERAFDVAGGTEGDGHVLILQPRSAIPVNFAWYLRRRGERVQFGAPMPGAADSRGQVVVGSFDPDVALPPPGFRIAMELQPVAEERRFKIRPWPVEGDYVRFVVLSRDAGGDESPRR
ncbi:MAG: glycosyltransferase family 39 protein [bacterium]